MFSLNFEQVLLIYHLVFILGGLLIARLIPFVFKKINWRTEIQDQKTLKKILSAYLIIFPILWIVLVELPLSYDFWENLANDGYKFYIPFVFLSVFWSIITWHLVPPGRRRKKLIYFLVFLAYTISIGVLFSAYSLSHFGF